MIGFLEQLSYRSLESKPLSIRPRLLSRFESGQTAGTESAADETVESIPSTRDEPSQQDRSPSRIGRPSDSMERPLLDRGNTPTVEAMPSIEKRDRDPVQVKEVARPVPPANQDPGGDPTQFSSLSRRLDHLDQQIGNLSPRDGSSRSPNEELPAASLEPGETISLEETHHHHQHNAQHIHHSEMVEGSNDSAAITPQPDNRAPRKLATESSRPPSEPVPAVSIEPAEVPSVEETHHHHRHHHQHNTQQIHHSEIIERSDDPTVIVRQMDG